MDCSYHHDKILDPKKSRKLMKCKSNVKLLAINKKDLESFTNELCSHISSIDTISDLLMDQPSIITNPRHLSNIFDQNPVRRRKVILQSFRKSVKESTNNESPRMSPESFESEMNSSENVPKDHSTNENPKMTSTESHNNSSEISSNDVVVA